MPLKIPTSFKDEVRDRLGSGLVDMIRQNRVPLKRTGSNTFKAPCPFHTEKTGSFTVCDGDMGWHYTCYGCGAHGDAYAFMMQHANMDFVEAVEYVAAYVGMEVPSASPEQQKLDEHAGRLRDIVNRTSIWLQQRLYLPAADPIRAYLSERDIDEQDIRTFMIGHAPAFIRNPRRGDDRQWQDFIADLMGAFRFSRKEMVDSGVFREITDAEEGDKGSLRPFFTNRLMFTICDHRGRPVGFSGRTLAEGTGNKYVNTEETPIFRKRSLLYNEHRARQQAAKTDEPVKVVEGYTDVIAMEKKGLGPVVSCMGTAITPGQIESVFRVRSGASVNAPIFCLDGDGAGRKAAVAVSKALLPIVSPQRYGRIAILFHGQDPASLLRQDRGVETLREALNGAVSAPDFLFDEEVRAHQPLATPEQRAAFTDAVRRDIVDRIGHGGLKADYRNQFYQRHRAMSVQPPPFVAQRSVRGPLPKVSESRSESVVLAALLNHPSLFSEYAEDIARQNFGEMEDIKSTIFNVMGQADSVEEAERHAAKFREDPYVRDAVFVPMMEHSAPFILPSCGEDDARAGISAILRHMLICTVQQKIERLRPKINGSPEGMATMREINDLLASLEGEPT